MKKKGLILTVKTIKRERDSLKATKASHTLSLYDLTDRSSKWSPARDISKESGRKRWTRKVKKQVGGCLQLKIKIR